MSSGRGRFGPFSLWIGITALIVYVGFDPIYARILETGSEELRHFASSAFDAIYFVILPLAYFTGITFGAVAIFRRGDRRIAGIIGALLNGAQLLVWWVLFDLVWKAVSAFG